MTQRLNQTCLALSCDQGIFYLLGAVEHTVIPGEILLPRLALGELDLRLARSAIEDRNVGRPKNQVGNWLDPPVAAAATVAAREPVSVRLA